MLLFDVERRCSNHLTAYQRHVSNVTSRPFVPKVCQHIFKDVLQCERNSEFREVAPCLVK